MNYYNEIKNKLIDNEITQRVKDYSKNKSNLNTYFEVGRLLTDAGKHYGESVVKEYAIKLTKDLGKKYDVSTLFKIRKFYQVYSNPKMAPVVPQLSWSHYLQLITLNDINKINYYMSISIKYNLSKRQLQEKIKSKEYERLPEETKNKLVNHEEITVTDFVKNPVVIKNTFNTNEISEKMLKQLILENLDSFLHELGDGFTYVGNEYKISLGNNFNYVDLLLFNYIYNCFTVVELKVTELKKEHIGQIEVYMNYIDKNVKKVTQDKTIGIIIAKKDNKFVMEYCSNPKISNTSYVLE